MFESNKKNTSKNSFLIVLIQSRSIEAVIVEKNIDSTEIIYRHKENSNLHGEVNDQRLRSFMLLSLKRCMEKVLRDGIQKTGDSSFTKNIYIFLGTPWILGEKGSFIIKKDKPFLVTDQEILEYAHKSEDAEPEKRIIERFINQVKANGYKITGIIGKKALEVEVEIYKNTTSLSLITEIEDVIRYSFPHAHITTHSLTIALVNASKHFNPQGENVIVVPDEEITELILVKDSSIESAVSIPKGNNYLAKALSKKLKIEVSEAHEKINLLNENKLEDEHKEKTEGLLQKATGELVELLKSGLWEIKGTVGGFSNIIVFDEVPGVKMVWEKILKDQFVSDLAGKNANIIFVEKKDLIPAGFSGGHSKQISLELLSTILYLEIL